MPIKVSIVEDNDQIREGLSVLINGTTGFQCVATYPTAENALKYLPAHRPDVVLMDIHLPGMSGIECVRELKRLLPDLQIMMLTIYEDDENVFKSIVAGATGYVLKKTPPSELVDAISDLHQGGSPMSDRIARKVVQAFQRMSQEGAPRGTEAGRVVGGLGRLDLVLEPRVRLVHGIGPRGEVCLGRVQRGPGRGVFRRSAGRNTDT